MASSFQAFAVAGQVRCSSISDPLAGWLDGGAKLTMAGRGSAQVGGERVSVSAALPTVQGWVGERVQPPRLPVSREACARGRGPNPKPNSAPPPHLFLPLDVISISHGAALPRQCRTGPHPLINLNRTATAAPPALCLRPAISEPLVPEPAAMMKDGVHLHGACDHGDLLA